MRPNPRTQPTGRGGPELRSAHRHLRTMRNAGLCGRGHDRPQLMRISLGRCNPDGYRCRPL